jgi:phospholipid/cholesterol/gamma-HCH transport system substrate-binding protein
MKRLRTTGDRVVAVVALVALVLAASAVVVAVQRMNAGVHITAMFRDASPLYPGNAVRASGVQVGKIDSIDLVDGMAQVKMTVDDSVMPIHNDAKATIVEQDLLGERSITLDRGTPSAPLDDSSSIVIPVDHTFRSVDLQSILNGLDDPTGAALASFVTTLGQGVNGSGPQIAKGIEQLAPAFRNANDLSQVLNGQNALLGHLVDNLQPVLSAVDTDNGKKLDDVVGASDQMFGALADNRGAMQDALQRLPGALASAQTALANVAGVADDGTPTLRSLRPLTDQLTDVSGELYRFSDAADPALSSLKPVLERGRDLLDELRPVARSLHDAGPDLRDTAHNARPLVDQGLSGPGLTDLMEFVKNWSLSTNGYDGISHLFRVFVRYSPKASGQALVGPVPGAPYAPIQGIAPPDPTPGVAPLAPYPDRTAPARRAQKPGDNDVTGLSNQQEQGMVDQLMGGH